MGDYNAELYVKLYSKMALALGVTPVPDKKLQLEQMLGCDVVRRSSYSIGDGKNDSQSLLAIYNPGQYIPVDMDPDANMDDRYTLSVLFNVSPQFSWVFKPGSTTVSNTYESVLDNKEAPLTHLTEEQKAKLDEANNDVTDCYDDYTKYGDLYYEALDVYDAEYATAQNDKLKPVKRTTIEKLKRAKMNWDGLGHKAKYESAVSVIASFEALEPQSFWYKLSQRYADETKSTSLGSKFQPIGISPAYKDWFKDAGWTEFTFTQKDMDNQANSQAIGVAGKLDGSFGIFNISGSGDYHQDSKYEKINQTELKFSCKLKRVSLDRNWMNPLVFWSQAWRWSKASPFYGTIISSGSDIPGSIAPDAKCAMPVVPTAAIIAKDLVVTGTFQNTLVEELNRQIAANASVGIGPFAISGRFNMDEHEGSVKGTIATNGIIAKDIQIIALVCETLPKCPNPDDTLPWSSK